MYKKSVWAGITVRGDGGFRIMSSALFLDMDADCMGLFT